MAIRFATVEDIPQLQIIRGAVKENILNNPLLVSYNDYVSLLTENGKGWVHEINNSITGFAVVDIQKNNIWALFVDPAHEQKGIGRMLHDEMLSWYFQSHQQPLWLTTAAGTRAEQFYLLSGWEQIGVNASNEIIFEITAETWAAKNQCFPKITTERLKLRPISKQDSDNLFILRSNPIVNQHLDRTPPSQLSDVEVFIRKIKEAQKTGQSFYWIIEENSSHQFLGTICLYNMDQQTKSAEIGYELLPQFHGKGYMPEAIDAVIDFLRHNHNINMLTAFSTIANENSSRLLQKKGFIQKPSPEDGFNFHVFSIHK
jgi:Acetyltransferases, including N-acetylases of ribosomal proteins